MVPEVVPDVVPIEPEVEPEVLPEVVLIEPEVEPEVLPEVEPDVVPEPAFSEAEQALKRASDAHSKVPVSTESLVVFIMRWRSGKEEMKPCGPCLHGGWRCDFHAFLPGKYVFFTRRPLRLYR